MSQHKLGAARILAAVSVFFLGISKPTDAQQVALELQKVVTSHVINDFPVPPGRISAGLQARIDEIVRDVSAMLKDSAHFSVTVLGTADAIRWNYCTNRSNRTVCDSLYNQSLALLRAGVMASRLAESGVREDKIFARGKVEPIRGAQFRRVMVFVHSGSLDVSKIDLSRLVAQLRLPTDTVVLERPPEIIREIREVPKVLGVEGLSLGLGASGALFDEKTKTTVNISIAFRPNMLPFEGFVEAGVMPRDSPEICKTYDGSGLVGANVLRGSLQLTGGAFTVREFCNDGGPKLTERWLRRFNGLFAGPSLVIKMSPIAVVVNPNIAWGHSRTAGTRESNAKTGYLIRVLLRTQ